MVAKLEWSMLDGAIKRCQQKYNLATTSSAFPYLVLTRLFPDIEDDIEDLITDGGNDCGVDAVHINRIDNNAHVHIFQFKCGGKIENAEKYFSANQADKTITFVSQLFDEDAALEKTCNPYLWDKVQEVWEIIREAKTKFTVYFCSNGKNLAPEQSARVRNFLSKYNVELKELNFESVLKLISDQKENELSLTLTAIDRQIFERSDGDIRGIVANISARDLIKAISISGDSEKINAEIFDQNIRVYLGSDNAVNESIIKSALSEQNSRFWYLNNGITAVCSSFTYQPGARSPVIEIQNLQIVNGAQTSYALFEANKKDPDSVDNVLLLIRLYETKNQMLPYEIAVATNSQTRISNRDLMSNSSMQKKLESAFLDLGYFYERKKNQYKDHNENQKIDAFKLGQIILAYDFREPERSKTDSDKIFGSRYEEIFTSNHDIEHLLGIYRIFQKIEQMRYDINIQKKRGTVTYVDSFLTYGQFHILYLVSLVAEKNEISIQDTQNIDRLINDALVIMRKFITSQKNQSFYNLFRNPKTKEGLSNAALQKGQLELGFKEEERMAKAG